MVDGRDGGGGVLRQKFGGQGCRLGLAELCEGGVPVALEGTGDVVVCFAVADEDDLEGLRHACLWERR